MLAGQNIQAWQNVQREAGGLSGAVVHLPVACNNRDSLCRRHGIYLSSSAATPGSVLPSRNSSEAPPPVETWVISSAAPACSTAAAESPPPIMVVAPALVRISSMAITALVPSAKAGISATPNVPFQTM